MDWRERGLLWLQQGFNAFWWYRAFPWTFAGTGTCQALQGQHSMFVPRDFYSIGPYTTLWKYLDPADIPFRHQTIVRNQLRRSPTSSATKPDMWTLLGQASTGLTTPSPPGIANQGTPGVTAYAYKIVAKMIDNESDLFPEVGHTPASGAGVTGTGNASLDETNFNRITWTAVTGAESYDVYRTTGGSPTPPVIIASGIEVTTFDDTGIVGTAATPPTTDTTLGFSKLIVFAPNASVDTTFKLDEYRMKCPVLVDERTVGGTLLDVDAAGSEGETLKMIPEQYHEPVLLQYLKRRFMGDEGDDREPLADQEFRMALATAWAEENTEHMEVGRLPPSAWDAVSDYD